MPVAGTSLAVDRDIGAGLDSDTVACSIDVCWRRVGARAAPRRRPVPPRVAAPCRDAVRCGDRTGPTLPLGAALLLPPTPPSSPVPSFALAGLLATGGVRSPVMATARKAGERPARAEQEQPTREAQEAREQPGRGSLDTLLSATYLDGIESKSLEELRAVRATCQEAEVSLSYLRRLAQGRLDIVHRFLDGSVDSRHEALAELVDDLPGILSAGSPRPAGPGRLPVFLAPDIEGSDLTAELDAVLGADGIAGLADADHEALVAIASELEVIEHRLSTDRRALHERIDAIQAEIVGRYKSGRASVDGLLS